MPFVKHFVRLITPTQLDDDDVIEFFDIVQSHVPTKLASAFTDDEEVVAVQVTMAILLEVFIIPQILIIIPSTNSHLHQMAMPLMLVI